MPSITRRTFVQGTAATAVAAGVHSALAPVSGQSPNEKLRIASVGTSNRAEANLQGTAQQEIVALADIDSHSLGRAAEKFQVSRTYRDYREMFEKESQRIDAVLVSTPDHSHAPAAALALRMGKHVYCEKPLAHTVYEARRLAELARENKCVTQMGTQIHAGENYRRVVELIESGAIGPVERVHVWAGAKYSGASFKTAPQPAHVDWDLWLGPAPKRPYSEGVHPFKWRSFWDYGTGALGDFGCHYMDLPHWALKLRNPVRVNARGPEYDAVSTPAWCIVDYHYPARDKLPPVHLTWYDSGRRPRELDQLKDGDGKPLDWGSGQLFVGSEGMLLSNYSQHLLLPTDKFVDFQRPEPSIAKSVGHHQEWIDAIRNGGNTTCNFAYSGALTESVLLGTVAYRAGAEIKWDARTLTCTNHPKAQHFIHKEYRKGWSL